MPSTGQTEVDANSLVTTSVTVPPDGGWGWAVVFAAFFVQASFGATLLSIGSLVEAVAREYRVTLAHASIFSSLFGGVTLCIGPAVSMLANRCGFRIATCLGTIIGIVAFSWAYISPDLLQLALSYGVFGGIGYGMVFIPSVIVVMFYFKKRRALAQCISVLGSSIGGTIAPPLIHISVERWGWRYTVLIEAGMMISCGLVSLLYVPVKRVTLTAAVGAPSKSRRCDCRLAQSPSYLMFLVSGCLTMTVHLVPFIYLPNRARVEGVDDLAVQMLVPTINIASTVGRIACGVMSLYPHTPFINIFSTTTAVAGIALALSSLSMESSYQLGVACVYGIYWAVLNSLRVIILLDLVGLDKLTSAFGLMMFSQGICAMIGPPLAGQLKEWTHNYDTVFWFAGGVMLLAALFVIPLPCVSRWEKERNGLTES